MSNKNYDLIHADEGVKLGWDEKRSVLTVSGEGRCELGEVCGGLRTLGSVEVEAQTVGGWARRLPLSAHATFHGFGRSLRFWMEAIWLQFGCSFRTTSGHFGQFFVPR